MQMLTGIRAYYWTPFFAALILGLLLWTFYRIMAAIFVVAACWFSLSSFCVPAPQLERTFERHSIPHLGRGNT